MSKLETYTGAYMDYSCPSPAHIDIKDIAHALSLISRFNGHTERFYSVAEHALLTYHLEPQLGLAVLHHDSHEAYLGDIPTPLKQHLTGWKGLAGRIDKAIAESFGFHVAEMTHPDVKAADRLALRIEAHEMKRSGGLGEYWGNTAPPPVSAPWPLGLTPKRAENQFMRLHTRLVRAAA